MTINNSIENGGNAGQVAGEAASMGRRNPPLSDTALVLLSAAVNRESGSILPPPAYLKVRGGALTAVLSHLLARELVDEFAVALDAESWRRDHEASRIGLRITPAGCAVIGVEAGGDGSAMAEPDLPVRQGSASNLAAVTSSSGLECNVRSGHETEVTDDPLDGTITWTDASEDAVGRERDSKSDHVPTRLSSPRSPSKQNQIIALLSRTEGATIDDLMAATGWLPHTVRAVLSGLRKKGHSIDRQKDGDAGSVYRILQGSTDAAVPSATGEAV